MESLSVRRRKQSIFHSASYRIVSWGQKSEIPSVVDSSHVYIPTDCSSFWRVLKEYLVALAAKLNNKCGGGLSECRVPQASLFFSICLTCPNNFFSPHHRLSVIPYTRGHFIPLNGIFLLNTSFLFSCHMRNHEFCEGVLTSYTFSLSFR